MKYKKTIDQLIDNKLSPLPLEVIPNSMGINLCAVEAIEWEKQETGQLVNLTIQFTPQNYQ